MPKSKGTKHDFGHFRGHRTCDQSTRKLDFLLVLHSLSYRPLKSADRNRQEQEDEEQQQRHGVSKESLIPSSHRPTRRDKAVSIETRLKISGLYTIMDLWWLGSRVISVLYSASAEGARVQIAAAMLSGNSLTQTVHARRASVHQAAKLVAALLRVARVAAGMAESDGSLPPGL